MDYRNINRSLVFNKAVKRFNADYSCSLYGSDVYILLSVSYGHSSIIGIKGYLKGFRRAYPFNVISDKLKGLFRLGYVERDGAKWVLSVAGRNALNSLEQLVRDCRYDK